MFLVLSMLLLLLLMVLGVIDDYVPSSVMRLEGDISLCIKCLNDTLLAAHPTASFSDSLEGKASYLDHTVLSLLCARLPVVHLSPPGWHDRSQITWAN